MNIGFLFNHYLTYQVLHGAPFAFELSRLHPDFVVDILCSTPEILEETKVVAELYPEHRCNFLLLNSNNGYILPTDYQSIHRLKTLWANREKLATYDALLAPEKNFILLKALPSFRQTRFIGLRHGAGDRPVIFNKGWLKFDYLLVPGQAYFERFGSQLPSGHCEIVGYPKFEVLEKKITETSRFFNDEKPVILYTPHFNPKQSSWIKMGEEVLNYFAKNTRYNLIFAPHTRLFKHRRYHNNINVEAYKSFDNILIDIGSEHSSNMTYTKGADIYLGDVSSQVYEFVYKCPRPCVYLNAHGLPETSMNFWKFGPVISTIDQLDEALERSQKDLVSTYQPEQELHVRRAFSVSEQPPSTRGAKAIARFLSLPSD